MSVRGGVFAWGFSAFLMLFYAALSIVKGGIYDIGLALVLILPFLFVVFSNCRKIWHVLILIFLTTNEFSFPLYGLKKLTPIFILLGAASLTVLMDQTIRHSRKLVNLTLADRLIAATSLILSLRFLYDRPGFVALGMGQGGFIPAITIVSATWFYFTVRMVVAQAEFTRRQLIIAVRVVAIICAFTVYDATKMEIYIGRSFGGEPFWLLCALMLPLLATATTEQKRYLIFYLTSLAFLVMGAVSQFRSRIFFYAVEIFSVAFFMKRLRKTVFVVGICGAIGITGIIGITGTLPDSMARVASLFTDVEAVQLVEGSTLTGRYGWEDSFRGALYEDAWEEIKRSPIFGNGFGLDVIDAVGILSAGGTQIDLLILSGAYHNSIVVIAEKCGLPAAILVSLSLIMIIRKYVRWVIKVEDVELKTWGMVLVAFWCANTFMMLMNGGKDEFFAELILSGFMMGMMNNPKISDPVSLMPLSSEDSMHLPDTESGTTA